LASVWCFEPRAAPVIALKRTIAIRINAGLAVCIRLASLLGLLGANRICLR
jgi:hypothetical protein